MRGDEGELHLAHVLFCDIVGYSLLHIDEQTQMMRTLQEIVSRTEVCRRADARQQLVRLPAGDGMALAFLQDPSAPVRCALDIMRALQEHPEIRLRIGVHSGPVFRSADINANLNVVGSGINVAQRVMDCGDAGHILVSRNVAEVLSEVSHWQGYLHDLGEVEVKHGMRMQLFNLCGEGLGNAELPSKLRGKSGAAAPDASRTKPILGEIKWHKRGAPMVLATLVVATIVGYFAYSRYFSGSGEVGSESPAEELRASPANEPVQALRVPSGDPRPSIAVLPFTDLSPGKDQEYLSDGIAEELLNLLAMVPQLRVISRSSAFSFKGKNIDVAEIAMRLNVEHVLEGSVRKSGDRVRVSARLVDARSDAQLWSQTWNRKLDYVFAVQDEIAAAVVKQLKIDLLGETSTPKAVNAEAYVLFLQAREVARQGTAEGWAESNALYEQVLALEPGYAPAWGGLADNYMNQVGSGLRPMAEGVPLAREAVRKALALDPGFALGYGSLGWFTMSFDGDLAAAARHFEHALKLAPANTDLLRNAATLAQHLGRLDMAVALGEYVVAQDPVAPNGHHNLGTAQYYAGRLDESIESMRTVLRLAPGHFSGEATIGAALLAKGEPEAALAAIERESHEVWRLIGLPMAYHDLGRKAESDAAVVELIEKYERDAPYNIAYVFAYLGEADRAFAWLDRAVASGDPGLLDIAVQPEFASIRNDPRWVPFLRKFGRAPEQLAAIPFKVGLPR